MKCDSPKIREPNATCVDLLIGRMLKRNLSSGNDKRKVSKIRRTALCRFAFISRFKKIKSKSEKDDEKEEDGRE